MGHKWQHRVQRGDTIVEVMFAIAVFALVATGSLAIMNRGVETTQRSLELTQTRKSINDQAETLRYAEQDGGTLWKQLVALADANTSRVVSPYGHLVDGRCPANLEQLGANNAFVVDPTTMRIETSQLLQSSPSVAYPQLVHNRGAFQGSYGMWVEAVPSADHFIDFHIRACWDTSGGNVPSTLGTIVRLYAQ